MGARMDMRKHTVAPKMEETLSLIFNMLHRRKILKGETLSLLSTYSNDKRNGNPICEGDGISHILIIQINVMPHSKKLSISTLNSELCPHLVSLRLNTDTGELDKSPPERMGKGNSIQG